MMAILFSALMCHELRTLVRALLGAAALGYAHNGHFKEKVTVSQMKWF